MKDLNHLELPPALVAGLYPASLVEDKDSASISPVPPPEKKENTEPFRSLGGNEKHILILVSYPETVYLPDDELAFLQGILKACKLGMGDVAIVNKHLYPAQDYKALTGFFKSRVVLLFAVEPASLDLPLNFPYYQLQPFAGNSFLYAPALKDLVEDKVEKSKLWVCLKRLFSL